MDSLGASYSSDGTTLVFRVFSSQATRIELWIYADGTSAKESLRMTMVSSAANSMTFEATIAVTALLAAGVTGAVYYGYRAWGPNWDYDPAWTPGSAWGFQVDA